MSRLQFRTLYREFLLRIIDLDLIAPQGDISKLLGQFATILVFISLWLTPVVLALAGGQPVPAFGLIASWTVEHFLIATTMLVVGLFAVLSWNSTFPDRRDVLILSPLPVPARTMFLAKVAAVATSLCLSIGALNLFTGFAGPFAFAGAPVLPPPAYDHALEPVSAAGLKPVLDSDLQPALQPNGALAPGSPAGVSIAVVKHGERRIFTYGVAQPDSIYEIGSITKTFTGLILGRMIVEGKVRFDEPVRDLLPDGVVAAPAAPEITLGDLVTHHSGLPGMPGNFDPNGYPNPGADYHAPDLYAYLANRGVAKPMETLFRYSNLGFGLLGTALANRLGTSYAALLTGEVTGPLGLSDTALRLTPDQRQRLIQAFNYRGKPIPAWDLDALAPAGAIRSTAIDMLDYLEAQLHPETLPAGLREAVLESHHLRAEAGGGQRIGFAWLFDRERSTYWHNGSISGYTSYAFFNLAGDYAGVALYNYPSPAGFVGLLGQHLDQRLAGRPAISLASRIVTPESGLLAVLRAFEAYWVASLASAVFIFCSVLTLQGMAQLLPRQVFLRVSSALQMLFFVALLTGYFWQIPFAGPDAVSENQAALFWIPSYWFFGLFQLINGPRPAELDPLIRRACIGLAVACSGAVASYLICYYRTLKKIAEQPDILPNSRRFHWLPPLGPGLQTALGHFAIRTLLRSRQHRVILAFYLGIALGLAIFFSKAPELRKAVSGDDVWYHTNAALLVASALTLAAAVIGARVVFSIPLEIRANWIFRVLPLPGVPQCLSAARRTIYFFAIAPVWLALAAALLWLWPLRYALEHLAILVVLAAIVTELCLYGFRKVPFTCTYLPGKTYVHMAILAFAGLMLLSVRGAALECRALDQPAQYAIVLSLLIVIAALARWRTFRQARSEVSVLQFEDPPDPAITSLGLVRDGVLPIDEQPVPPLSAPG